MLVDEKVSPTRKAWKGQRLGLTMERPKDGFWDDKVFTIFVRTLDGALVPWEPTHEDLLAEDWY